MKNVAIMYLRKSTENQSESQSAQEEQIRTFLAGYRTKILATYRESASARNETDGVNRPEFKKAISQAMRRDGFVVVATIDRFTRTTTTFDSFCDLGGCVVAADQGFGQYEHVMRGLVARAQENSELTSRRTREGQRKARERGVIFGAPDIRTNAQPKGVDANVQRARSRYERFKELEAHAVSAGMKTAAGVADFLNLRGHRTARGCPWSPANVLRMRRQVKRYDTSASRASATWLGNTKENPPSETVGKVLLDLGSDAKDSACESLVDENGRFSESTLRRVRRCLEDSKNTSEYIDSYIRRLRPRIPSATIVARLTVWLPQKEKQFLGRATVHLGDHARD
jgi:DNA invertase Pin-like site-specific DNA recombinase